MTPVLTKIKPRYGSVEGNTNVVFSGDWSDNLDTTAYTILIDDIECAVNSVDASSLTCTTGSRPGLYTEAPTLEIYVDGVGKVAT